MNLSQAVRKITVDKPDGCLFVQHLNLQISPLSSAYIAETGQAVRPGFIQFFSCEFIAAVVERKGSVSAAVNELVSMHNNDMQVA